MSGERTEKITPIGELMRDRLAELRQRWEQLEKDPAMKAALEARDREREARREAEARDLRRAALEAAGVPLKVLDELERPEERVAIQAVREWFAGEKTFLILAGDVDTGKTFAAAFAVSEWFRTAQAALRARDLEVGRVLADAGVEAAVRAFGASERPTRGTPLFRKARQIAALSQYDEDGWRQLHRAPFLAVDDLGTEALDAKDWGAAGIRDLIDRRYDDERRTILTMNLSVETFRARYAQDGGRLFRRFREAAEWIEIAAPTRER